MVPAKRPHSRGKIQPGMVARARVLFRHGEPRETVIAYFLKHYGKKLGIITPAQMERLLFVKTRGSHPNFAELFENKPPQEVDKNYREWIQKRAARAASIRTAVGKRLADPRIRQEVSERSKRVMSELQNDPTFRAHQSASAKKTMKAWRNTPEGKQKHARVMRELRSDPFWRERRAESVRQGAYKRWLNERKEAMKKIIENGALRIETAKGNKQGKRRTRFLLVGPPTAQRPLVQVRRVQRALARLSPIETEAIAQVFVENRPIEKVAKSLGQTPESLFKIIGPAYKKIMRAFKG